MAEVQKSATSAAVAVAIPEGHEYITIPRKNIHNWDHPGVGINLNHWGPGKHLVTSEQAAEINEILERYSKEMIRIISPQRDLLAVQKEREIF